MTASACDAPLSGLRESIENLAAALAVWEHRHEPDAHARRCASDAVDAVDAMLRSLYDIRARRTGEIREADDAAAARPTNCCAGTMTRRPGKATA
jgi:hypothetical protein